MPSVARRVSRHHTYLDRRSRSLKVSRSINATKTAGALVGTITRQEQAINARPSRGTHPYSAGREDDPMGPVRGPLLAHTAVDPPSFSLLPTHDTRRVVLSFGQHQPRPQPLLPPPMGVR